MMDLRCLRVGAFCGAVLLFTAATPGQILNSWEGSLEGWTPYTPSFTLANTAGGPHAGVGVTHGTDSLQVTIPTQGFQRWGQRAVTGSALTDLQTAAATPLTRRFEFDVTYDVSLIPQGTVTYINQQLAVNTSGGWSQVDFVLDQTNGSTNTTTHFMAPISRFSSVTSTITSATMYIATNSNWGANQAGSIFVDNLRISPIVPDLDEDQDVDAADWTRFLLTHPSTLPLGLTAQQRFLQGDLDGDGTNGFNDFLVFEATYDEINGTGSFQEMVLGVPEPAVSLALTVPAIVWLIGGRRRLRRARIAALLLLLCVAGFGPPSASAQLLNSWESGLEGWNAVGFGAVPATVSTSTVGATNGSQSLAIEQSEGNVFSWNAQVNYGTGSVPYQVIAQAIDTGLEHFALEFDATFDTSFIPQGSVSYVSISVALNSNGGWFDYGGVGFSSGSTNETVHISIPLDQAVNPPNGSGHWVPSNQTGWYQINLGMDGDWGLNPATVFFDDLRLVQTSVPDTLTLEVDRSNGHARIWNNGTGGSFDFNYYSITSPGNSLSVTGWESLDDQNIDAVDGPDPGVVAGDSPLEGWDEAGASGAGNLTEAFLIGSSNLPDNDFFQLGEAYHFGVDAMDLQFRYRDLTRPGVLTNGRVVYINEPPSVDGDFNNDGLYDCLDVDALVADIAAGSNTLAYDLTGDGLVNLDDRDAWLSEAGNENLGAGRTYLLGDATLDGVVDGSDFGVWNSNKFTSVAAWCSGDFNADGAVDGSDFGMWNSNKFTSSDAAVVPEPIGWILPLAGMIGLGRRRRGLR